MRYFLVSSFLLAGLAGCAATAETEADDEPTSTAQQAAVSCAVAPTDPLLLDAWITACGTATPCASTKVAIGSSLGDRCLNACPPDHQRICATPDGRCRCQWRASFAPDVTSVAAGTATSYASDRAGNVWAWGSGNGSMIPGRAEAQVPVPIAVRGAEEVVAGDKLACVRTTAGEVVCWGTAVPAGGGSTFVEWAEPTKVAGIPAPAVGVTIGSGHACAWTAAGKVYCWGDADFGQTGDGREDHDEDGFLVTIPGRSKATAQEVAGLTGVTKVVASGYTTCALTQAGKVHCFGSNHAGGLANGAGAGEQSTPLELRMADRSTTALFGGGGTFCADLASPQQRFCWGANEYGQTASSLPADIVPSINPQDLLGTAALGMLFGGPGNFCQRQPSYYGTPFECWGNNAHGQLQRAASSTIQRSAVKLASPQSVSGVAIGHGHMCAASSDVFCWGNNSSSQVLDRDLASNNDAVLTPVAVQLWDKWPQGKVPVCFDASTRRRADFAERAREIKRRAMLSWSTVASVDFTGWGACPANTEGMVVLRIDDTAKSSSCFGYQAKAACNVSLGTQDPAWSTSLISSELGRVIGVAHDGWTVDTNGRPAQGGADVAMVFKHVTHAQRMYGRRIDGVRLLRRADGGDDNRAVGISGDDGARYVQPEGWILATPAPGTVAIRRWTNGSTSVLTKALDGLPFQTGFTSMAVEGYVYTTQQPGTVPVKTFYHAGMKRYMTVATAQGTSVAERTGYTLKRTEGYVFADVPYALTVRFRKVGEGGAWMDHLMATLTDPTGTGARAEALGYRLRGIDGAVLKHSLPGTASFMNYWHAAYSDYYTTTKDDLSTHMAFGYGGYLSGSLVGYVFTAPQTNAAAGVQLHPLETYVSPSKEPPFWAGGPLWELTDRYTIVSPNGAKGAEDSDYKKERTEGYAYPLSRY